MSLHQVVLLLLHLLHAAEKHAGVVKGLIFSTVLIRSSVSAVMVSLLQDAEGCALLYAFRVSRLGEVIVSSEGTWGVGNLFWPMLCLFLWSFIFRGFLVCLFSFYSRCFFLLGLLVIRGSPVIFSVWLYIKYTFRRFRHGDREKMRGPRISKSKTSVCHISSFHGPPSHQVHSFWKVGLETLVLFEASVQF